MAIYVLQNAVKMSMKRQTEHFKRSKFNFWDNSEGQRLQEP